jgi:hypothetical protein
MFMLLFFSIFGFVGVSVLIFLWSQSPHEFGAPPLIFRVVGSFIALGFILMGFGVPLSALRNRGQAGDSLAAANSSTSDAPASGYKCPNCGAGLGSQEVSPSGDVKCSYCQKWWNIHR